MNKLVMFFICLPMVIFACGSSNQNPQGQNRYDYSAIPKVDTVQDATQTPAARATANQLNDADLKSQIKDQLAGGWFGQGFEALDIDVNNGIVTITGIVLSENDKIDVERRIKEFPQVKQVINRLQVQAPANY